MAIDSFTDKYFFLSNFAETPNCDYKTLEHAYQAAKTHSKQEKQRILSAPTPGVSKRLGRDCTLRPDWEKVKLSVMEALVYEKFLKHPDYRQLLLKTDPQELIEGNWWGDRYWGVCKGYGENHLGKILMRVRENIGQQV